MSIPTRTTMKILPCAFLLAMISIGAADTNAQEPARVLRMIPVRDLLSPAITTRAPVFGSFLGQPGIEESALLGRGASNLLQQDELAELLFELRGDLDGRFSLSQRGAVLMVSGADDAVRQAEDLVERLRRAMVREVRLEAALYRLPPQAQVPVVANAETLARLTEDLIRVWSASTTVRAGARAELANTTHAAYVRDVDTEVAQDSQIADPIVGRAFEGVHLVVEPHSLARTDDLVMFAQFAFGERRGPFANRRTGVRDHPPIDVPVLDANSGTFSGRLPNGSALLLAVRSAHEYASNLLLTVQATAAGGGDQERDDLAIHPISALTSDALRDKVLLDRGDNPFIAPTAEAGSDYFGPRNADELLALLEESDPQEAALRMVRGGYLIVRGPPAVREFASGMLQTFQDRWLRTVQIDVETVLADAADRPGALLHAVSFPGLLGRAHALVSGRQTTTVADFAVEIAQEASIADPLVTDLFNGIELSCFPYPDAAAGAIGAQAELQVSYTPPTERRALETRAGGDLYLPQTSTARYAHNGSLLAGRDLSLGAGPDVGIGGKAQPTRQILRISVR
jgi:hypothetical protein